MSSGIEVEDTVINIFDAKAVKTALFGESPARVNPFLAGMVVETKKKTGALIEVSTVYDEDGTAHETEIVERRYVDKAAFIKIMQLAYFHAYGLSTSGQKLFWLLVEEVMANPGRDTVYLSYRKVFTVGNGEVTLPKSTFFDGVKALLKAGFIAKQEQKGFYWLNPSMLWNGDRVKLVQEFVLKNPGLKEDEKPKVLKPKAKKGRDDAGSARAKARARDAMLSGRGEVPAENMADYHRVMREAAAENGAE